MLFEKVNYKLYPTLLNAFDRYEKGYINAAELIDRVNRLPFPRQKPSSGEVLLKKL